MPAWLKLMKESLTTVELDPSEVDALRTFVGRYNPTKFPGIKRLINHEGPDFLFLDGPDSFQLPDEIAMLQYERGKSTDVLGKKLDDFRNLAGSYSLRIVIARRPSRQNPLSLSIIEKLPQGGGMSEQAQFDLSFSLRSLPRKFRFLQEMKPSKIYPDAENVLDKHGIGEFVAEIDYLLSEESMKTGEVTPVLAAELRDILPILQRAIKESLYVWLSKA